MPPKISYVVWHTQRTGSTLLCTTLQATGIAGVPDEWPEVQLTHSVNGARPIRDRLWSEQTTPNGVLGVKWSYYQPTVEQFFDVFGRGELNDRSDRRRAWDRVFPNCHHVVMTRRNKIRLAVSWWKSIQGGPGHLSQDGSPLPWQRSVPRTPGDLVNAYNFRAIKALMLEAVRREAHLQELLTELGALPLSITYEDLVLGYESTVRDLLRYLGLDARVPEIPPPLLAHTSDEVNDDWAGRFLIELDRDADSRR